MGDPKPSLAGPAYHRGGVLSVWAPIAVIISSESNEEELELEESLHLLGDQMIGSFNFHCWMLEQEGKDAERFIRKDLGMVTGRITNWTRPNQNTLLQVGPKIFPPQIPACISTHLPVSYIKGHESLKDV